MRASERETRKRADAPRDHGGGPWCPLAAAALLVLEDTLHTPLRARAAHELGFEGGGPLGLPAIQPLTLTTPCVASGAPPASSPAPATRCSPDSRAASNRYRCTASPPPPPSPWACPWPAAGAHSESAPARAPACGSAPPRSGSTSA